MTPEQQRIAIAKACGYRDGELKPFWLAPPIGQPFIACGINQLPDYLNDLNAMHEAEKVLNEGQKMPYARKLLEIVTGCPPHLIGGFLNGGTLWDAVIATSAQRAEAFLRTLNLWTP